MTGLRAWAAALAPLFVLPVALVGCAGSAPPRANAPDWYMQPPAETGAFYAAGEGTTSREATRNARASLAAQLRVHVTSELRSLQLQDGEFHRLYFEERTEQRVAELAMLGARVVRQEQRGTSHFALMTIDEQSIVRQQSQEMEHDARRLRALVKNADGGTFDAWWKLARAGGAARRLAGNLTLLAMLGEGDHQVERALLERYREAALRSERAKRLQLVDRTRIAGLRELLSQQLEREGIQVVRGGLGASLEATAEYRSERIADELYVDAVLWVRLRSARGGILSQFPLRAQVVSLGGLSEGRRRAREALFRRLEETSVFERLIEAA